MIYFEEKKKSQFLLRKYNDFKWREYVEKWNFIFQCILIDSVRVWNNWTLLRPSSTRQSISPGPVPPRPAPRRAVDPPRPTWGPVSLSYSRNKSSATEKGMGPKLETGQNTRDILLISLLHVMFLTLYLQLFDSNRYMNEVWMCSWKIICMWLKIYSVEFFVQGFNFSAETWISFKLSQNGHFWYLCKPLPDLIPLFSSANHTPVCST